MGALTVHGKKGGTANDRGGVTGERANVGGAESNGRKRRLEFGRGRGEADGSVLRDRGRERQGKAHGWDGG